MMDQYQPPVSRIEDVAATPESWVARAGVAFASGFLFWPIALASLLVVLTSPSDLNWPRAILWISQAIGGLIAAIAVAPMKRLPLPIAGVFGIVASAAALIFGVYVTRGF